MNPASHDTPTADRDGYCRVRSLTETLAGPLSAEDQTVQSMPDVSPTKWHRAHTTWFFEEFVLAQADGGYTFHDESYRYLFNSYYEAVGPRHDRPARGLITRPGVADVTAYRGAVDAVMCDRLESGLDDGLLELVELGLHHEQQHQELLLMDIKHVLSCNPLRPSYTAAPPAAGTGRAIEPGPRTWTAMGGGVITVGHDGDGFSYDNETPRHDVLVGDFALADGVVTAGEWIEFIQDDGYRTPSLWLSDGWAAVQADEWHAPAYWSLDDGAWSVFTLQGERPVLPDEPVCHISYYEADAFARWAGVRLPTEQEWEWAVATAGGPIASQFDPERHHPAASPSGTDLISTVGAVWEWTASPYTPYPGFRPAPGAVGEYNGKFMVNQHVLRGASCATPPGHARSTYRNFFPPGSRWPFTGVRLAADR